MLGTQTRGGRMVGADEFTELWRHPSYPIFTFLNFSLSVGFSASDVINYYN